MTKSMSNMIREVGGATTKKAKEIMSNRLYGIEIDKRVFSLACANMLIHKDGKTNLEQMDSTSQEACDWIKSKGITKVLMNPPYERKSHPEIIIKNVLDNVTPHTTAAFLLPDKKLEKISKKFVKSILSKHRLLKIIKLPDKTFDEGITTSIFIFERREIEDRWVDIIKKQSGDESIKWINPDMYLSYQKDAKPFEVCEEDYIKTMVDYLMYKEEIDVKELKEKISERIIYFSSISQDENATGIAINIEDGKR